MEAKDDGDLHGGQRSTEVKCSISRIWFILFTLPFFSYEQYHQEIFSALKDQPKNLQKPVRGLLFKSLAWDSHIMGMMINKMATHSSSLFIVFQFLISSSQLLNK